MSESWCMRPEDISTFQEKLKSKEKRLIEVGHWSKGVCSVYGNYSDGVKYMYEEIWKKQGYL